MKNQKKLHYIPVLKNIRTQYNNLVNENMRNFSMTRKNAMEFVSKSIKSAKSGNALYDEFNRIQIDTIEKDNEGKIVHYFIQDNSLVDFLMNTEVKDYESIFNFISINGNLDKDNFLNWTIAIHSKVYSCCVYFLQKENEESHSNVFLMNDENNMFYQMGATKMEELTDEQKKIFQFVANFIYYINAFPDKITDGTPNDMISSERCETRNNHKIGISEKIVESHGVAPHFRKGFFRYYKDDRYVNMKGKVQFIESTFVKGSAKTVKE